MAPIAETPRFIIRKFNPDEEGMYLNLFDDARVTQYLPVYPKEKHIEMFKAALEESAPGSVTGRWGIFNKTDNDFIGLCLLRLFDDGSESVELGYVLAKNYWGRGVASEMAAALLGWASSIQPEAHFVAVTEFDNIPSQKVLEKSGMQRKGNYTRNGIELALFGM